ncbi:MAG TPA: ABC transporter ATP-binding protein [Acidimicrobiales bacterium]|jgi:ABC-type branched-subunit amino acid transport system ATPase component|nr:ABC transporter ATP-binding protein [Acidimicrobiales bacterium]
MLEVRDLTVVYGPVVALDGVSLDVAEGGSACLLGANGAGKTTLLRAASGLLGFHGGRITSGEIRYAGTATSRADPSRLVAAGMAQVLEGRRVFANLSVSDNLRAGELGASTGRARRRPRDAAAGGGRWGGSSGPRDSVLSLFPVLASRLEQPAGLLSGGEQQMLAVARALMSAPRLLLLDEPSLGLAPLAIAAVGSALAQINAEGVTILLAEQSRALAQAVTRDGYLIEHGTLGAHAPTAELLGDEQVRATYLGIPST